MMISFEAPHFPNFIIERKPVMKKCEAYTMQLEKGILEMEATVERLLQEIQRLREERNTLEQGNLTLYKKLTQVDF